LTPDITIAYFDVAAERIPKP